MGLDLRIARMGDREGRGNVGNWKDRIFADGENGRSEPEIEKRESGT